MELAADPRIQKLLVELADARQRVDLLESCNAELTLLVARYRTNWINECCLADARDQDVCVSQADWFSSSPNRNYGQ
jgi:hypothetical protein